MLAATAFGALLRVDHAALVSRTEPVADELGYDRLAVNLLRGDGYTFQARQGESRIPVWPHIHTTAPTGYVGPGYPLFLAGLYAVLGRDFALVRLAQVLLSSLLPLVLFMAMRFVLRPWQSVAVAAVAALAMPIVGFTNVLIPDALTLLLTATLLWQGMRITHGKGGWLTALNAGVLLGFLPLLRAETVALVPVFLLWILLERRHGRLRSAALVAVIAVAVFMPWPLRNAVALGEPVLLRTGGVGYDRYLQANETVPTVDGLALGQPQGRAPNEVVDIAGLDEIAAEGAYLDHALEFQRTHPAVVATLAARRLLLMIQPYRRWVAVPRVEGGLPLPGWILFALALLGAAFALPKWRTLLPLYAIAALYLACIGVLGMVFDRLRLHALWLPALAVFLVLGVECLARFVRSLAHDGLRALWPKGLFSRAALVVVLAAALAGLVAPRLLRSPVLTARFEDKLPAGWVVHPGAAPPEERQRVFQFSDSTLSIGTSPKHGWMSVSTTIDLDRMEPNRVYRVDYEGWAPHGIGAIQVVHTPADPTLRRTVIAEQQFRNRTRARHSFYFLSPWRQPARLTIDIHAADYKQASNEVRLSGLTLYRASWIELARAEIFQGRLVPHRRPGNEVFYRGLHPSVASSHF